MQREGNIRAAAQQLLESVIPSNEEVRLVYQGQCMNPVLVDGDILIVRPISLPNLSLGDLIAYRSQTLPNGPCNLVHRFLFSINSKSSSLVYAKADNFNCLDLPFAPELIIGKVLEVRRGGRRIALDDWRTRMGHLIFGITSAMQGLIYLVLSNISSRTVGSDAVPVWIRRLLLQFIGSPLRFCQAILTSR